MNDAATDHRTPKTKRNLALRDHFAGLAMQGIIIEAQDPNFEWIAHTAYKMADAMLKRRKRKE